MPLKKELSKKLEEGKSLLITDGAGGWIDLAPETDSVQHQVNDLHQGREVSWEFTLHAVPLVKPDLAEGSESLILIPGHELFPSLFWISVPKSAELDLAELKVGTRIFLKGVIDQNNIAAAEVGDFHGIVAVYYLQDDEKEEQVKFIIGMKQAKIEVVSDRD